MDQSAKTHPNEDQHDISACRVSRKIEDLEVCMMNKHCKFELPFWNICAHPMAKLIAEGGPQLK